MQIGDSDMNSSVRLRGVGAQLLLGVAACALVFAGGTSGVAAQSVATAASPGSDQIETVVVTAQKRSELLQKVPASITALDAKDFSSQGIYDLQDLAAQVPGLSLSSQQAGFTQITLRGITTGSSQSAATTSIYVDEAPIGSVNAYTHGSLDKAG